MSDLTTGLVVSARLQVYVCVIERQDGQPSSKIYRHLMKPPINKISSTVLTVAILASKCDFAETISTGSASTAPAFANNANNTTTVETIGTASNAPVYMLNSGTRSLVADLGSAKRAPVFAQAAQQNVHVALAR